MMTEYIKSIVRPFLIISSWIAILIMYLEGMEVPIELQGIAGAIVIEYFTERAIKRFKGK